MRAGGLLLGLLLALLLSAVPAAAQDLRLGLPVDCSMGRDCFVQNHVDLAAGPEAKDHTCGPLAYDGHKGTDIRVKTLADMERGVAVVAAADGTVKAVRDGEPDVSVLTRGLAAVANRECGNGVVLVHPDGWETQYCHLLRGSVAVRPGTAVTAGTPLARIGLSGRTECPHVHFQGRRGGRSIDPFSGRPPDGGCDAGPARPLWTEAAAAALPYRPSGILSIGFTDRKPDRAGVNSGRLGAETLPPDAGAIIFWANMFGRRAGDIEVLRVLDPNGDPLAHARRPAADRDQAAHFSFIGRSRSGGMWPAGTYVGEYWLLRYPDGAESVALYEKRTLTVR